LTSEAALIHATHPARQGSAPFPGLLLLHGRGTDEKDLMGLADELDDRLLVVSARGPFRFPYGGYAWYELDPDGVGYPSPDSLNKSVGLLERFLDDMVSSYSVDPTRLYVGGFSMGGAIAAGLALLFPERIAGAVILSSYLPLHAGLEFKTEKAAGHPFFQAHGIHDPVIPVLHARETRDFLATTDIDLTYREYPIAHQISAPELADLRAWFADVLSHKDAKS
jgi:phospholipase/carboxylesterase